MLLKVLGSSSSGNGYLFEGKHEALVIEAGVKYSVLKQAIDYKVSKIAGVLVSHSHSDHAGQLGYYLREGLEVFVSEATAEETGCSSHHRAHVIDANKAFFINSFHVLPFEVVHDVRCFGFLISHPESGRFVFITDTHYSPAVFRGLNNVIIETNYSEKIIDKRLASGQINSTYYDRVLRSHMSLETACDFLKANDLKEVNKIVLIHLSDGNSDAKGFKQKVEQLTGKTVEVAEAGAEISFEQYHF